MKNNLIHLILIAILFFNLPFYASILSSSAAATGTTPTIMPKIPFTTIPTGNNNDAKNTSCSSMKSTSSRGTLDIFVDPSPQPVGKNDQTKFKVIFLQKGSGTVQAHIDYDFIITKDGGKHVFQASALAGHPGIPLHTTEGIITIPYKFPGAAQYSVNVTVYGILFNEIRPEFAEFPINVTSEAGGANTNNNTTLTQQQPSGVVYAQKQQQEQQYSFVREWGAVGQYQFQYPTGVAVDSGGRVYIVDAAASTVMKFTGDGKFITKWGSSGGNDSSFHYPTAAAVDFSGKVYVSDFSNSVLFSNSTIQKFTGDGKFITKWGSLGGCDGQLDHPTGITVDSIGYVYISDHDNTRIQKFTGDGKFITKWGSSGSGSSQFNSIFGLAADHSNNVYVVDSGNNRIQKFDSNGKFITKWGSPGAGDAQFNHTRGIAVDSSNNVYVVDSGNDRIQKFDSNGKFITKWGSLGEGKGQFKFADSIAVDPSGKNVYVTDSDNRSIKVFTSTSNTTS